MCGALSLQRVLSGQLAERQFLLRPPEPSPGVLVSPPGESVYIGKTQWLRVPFFWNPSKLVNPHICVVGITGSGKSYFVKTFITRARLVFGVRALILDWAGEYADWVRLAGGRVVSFGEDGLNLLDLGGVPPHTRTRQVVCALEMLTDLSSFPKQRRLTEEAIEQAYCSKKFALHRLPGRKRAPPTLEDVYAALKKKSGREPEAAEAARRIRAFLLSSGKSFCSSTIGMGSLLSGLVCVDLHSLQTESMRSLAGLAILQFVKEKMRSESYQSEGKLRLFVVVDEAWKIASDERSDVISIVREGRKYGFGLIVASQNPTDVHRSIFSNAGTSVIFRLTLAPEREYVRSSLTYSDFYEQASHSMAVGQALVHLETAAPVSCPRNFILGRVEGEPLLSVARIRGGGMDIEVEKEALLGKLLSFGLTEKQASGVMAEFERKSFTLDAWQFSSLLERFGYGRASSISLLRELGADESGLLNVYSSGKRRAAMEGGEAVLQLRMDAEKSRPQAAGAEKGVRAKKGAAQQKARRRQSQASGKRR